ncbi:MAG: cohesin domain-containing protein [Candidatus Bathyarchaeia archaeon]
MQQKIKGIILTILALSLLYIFTTPTKVYAQNTKIYIVPSSIIDQTLTPGKTFNITVKIENIPQDPGLVGLQFKITWNPTILEGVSMTEILFNSVTPPNEKSNIWPLAHDVTASYAEYAYTWMNITRALEKGYAPISGNHTAAIITLKVKGVGKTILDLTNTKLGDPKGKPIAHEAFDGYFQNSPPPLPALLFVDPPKIFDITLTPCHNFTINVNISKATDIYSVEFKLGFDNSILSVVKAEQGDFIPPSVTPNIEINNAAGYMRFNVSLGTSLSGNGSLAIITFHVEGLGKSPLNLYDTKLFDIIGQPLPHTASSGSFNNILLAKLAVQPEEIIDPTLLPPSTFTINVTIADVEDLYGYEFNLTFNPNVLICLQITIHDVLNETNYIPNQYIDNLKGFITINVTYYPPATPLNIYAQTPLASIKFRVKAIGSSNLTLCNTKLINSIGQPIAHETYNGFFQSLIRDIAIVDLYAYPTAVYQGQKANITVTVRNEGNITETFSIKIYYDDTIIMTINITDLPPSEDATETITWSTNGVPFGNHTIKAEVPSVPYELDITDNIFFDGTVKIKIPGDINGDDIVDVLDALLASNAFGTNPGMPNWNPDCDINGDDIVDIFDMILLSKNFGKTV